MLDYWAGEMMNTEDGFVDTSIYIVGPAVKGHGGKNAPWWPTGECALLSYDYRCRVHEMKPLEGAVYGCQMADEDRVLDYHAMVARTWDSDEGRAVVELWEQTVGGYAHETQRTVGQGRDTGLAPTK
jgi:hypothetical protein